MNCNNLIKARYAVPCASLPCAVQGILQGTGHQRCPLGAQWPVRCDGDHWMREGGHGFQGYDSYPSCSCSPIHFIFTSWPQWMEGWNVYNIYRPRLETSPLFPSDPFWMNRSQVSSTWRTVVSPPISALWRERESVTLASSERYGNFPNR